MPPVERERECSSTRVVNVIVSSPPNSFFLEREKRRESVYVCVGKKSAWGVVP